MPEHTDCMGGFDCHVAPTSVIKAERCMFRWYAEKIARRLVKRDRRGAQIGTLAHAEIEATLHGEADRRQVSQLAEAALDAIPPGVVTDNFTSEHKIDHADLGLPWPMYGKIDLLTPGGITDFKFSKNPLEYLPDSRGLRTDPQMVMYDYWFVRAYRRMPTVRHIQTNTTTMAVRVCETAIPIPVLLARWNQLKAVAWEMHRCSTLPPELVPMNGPPGAGPHCNNDYGYRCEAFDFCSQTQARRPRQTKFQV